MMRGENTGADRGPIEADERPIPDDHEFALLLTHDIDRPYKTYQSIYYMLTDRDRWRYHLATALPSVNPYWQFDRVREIESDLGVRSAFYVLDEQRLFQDRPLAEWLTLRGWKLYVGRYNVTSDDDIADVLRTLDQDGWEVGLHGSFDSYDDPDRLHAEKRVVERVLGHELNGGRQHYLNLSIPETWRHHRAVGLRYDASLGSSETYGFEYGYGVYRPFDDGFVVFPLTLMEGALPNPASEFDAAWAICESLLEEACTNDAVMSVLWHPRSFSRNDFPNHGRLYRRLIERALELGAWVGSPNAFYEAALLGERAASNGDP